MRTRGRPGIARREHEDGLALALVIVLVVMVLGACTGVPTLAPTAATSPTTGPTEIATPSPAQPSAPPTTAAPSPVLAPTPVPTTEPTADTAACIDRVLAGITLAQRVGELISLGLDGPSVTTGDALALRRGEIGGVWIAGNRTDGVTSIRRLTDQVHALGGTNGGVGILVAADQEGGRIQRLTATGFSAIPTALEQGALDPARLRVLARGWGGELAAAGVSLDLAPVMDVVPAGTAASNAPIGALEREYGSDPVTVAAHGAAFVAGMADAGIGTTLKHFPGLGKVEANTDTSADVVDILTTADDPDLAAFAAGIRAGAGFVMISLATYRSIDPDRLAVFSPIVIRDLLRGRLGFDGVVVSDSLTAAAVARIPPGERALRFVAAGGDLILVHGGAEALAMTDALVTRASDDPAFATRVDDAVRRILTAKAALGLVACW